MNDPQFPVSSVTALIQDPGFRREAAQIQAKALLSAITDELPTYGWTYLPRRVIRNIVMATFDLELIAAQDPTEIDTLTETARRLALTWEALAQLREGTTRDIALLNAAIGYELAGYQANAACIARQLETCEAREAKPFLTQLFSLFLQRAFLKLLTLSREAQVEPRAGEGLSTSIVGALGTALAARALDQSLRFFLSGDDRSFESAIGTFRHAENVFSSLPLVDEANLVRSIRSLLPVMKRRATWTVLPRYAPGDPVWLRYLKLLARGTGPDVYRGRSVSELWPSQIAAIEQGLLGSTTNVVVRMPTSAGKTRIAELAAILTLVKNPGAKCVYIAPYRALVSELQQSFLSTLSDLGYRVSSTTGAYESDEFEEFLFRDTDFLVATPERLDLLLRASPGFVERVKLFIVDEAQIVGDQRRGVKFELLLTRLMRRCPTARFLVLSAVIPHQTLEDFAAWFSTAPERGILTSQWRPSIQRYAKFEWSGHTGVLRYAPEEEVEVLREFVPGVIRHQSFEFINPDTGRVNRRRFPDINNRAQVAAELAYKFAELGPVLVFCSQTNFVEYVARALQERLRLASLVGERVPPYFVGGAGTRSALLSEEWLGHRPITVWLKAGIGVHYGDLPDTIRNAVETDFRQKRLRVLIATNTLAQGVNLPVRTVIIHSTRRYTDEGWKPISARDYWNIAGRAGRAGEETEGLIIHIRIDEQDDRDFKYYLEHRNEVEPVRSALFQRLLDLLQRRLSDEGLKADLDPEILALVAEETINTTANVVQEIIDKSLAQLQARRALIDFDPVRRAFSEVAHNLATEIDHELVSVYSSTGLSARSCDAIRRHVIANELLIRDFFLNGTPEQLEPMLERLLPALLDLAEMRPEQDFGGNYTELLKRWVNGTEIASLIREFSAEVPSIEDLGRFIDDLFRYRLPWGISAYTRIAMKALTIERNAVSDSAKFLPSMVKFGLPDPVACWAMSVGIPFRSVAMKLAATYRAEIASTGYENFLEWVGTLSSDRLHYEFDLRPPLLDDVHRAVFNAAMNPLLRRSAALADHLPLETYVRGIQYENRAVVALRAEPGVAVELARDYDNPIDRNALAVHLHAQKLGYVPRELAQILAPEIDVGADLRAHISAVDKRPRLPRVKIRIDQAT